VRVHRRTDMSLDDLARWLNPIIAGWINYYGRYYRTALDPPEAVNAYLRRWAGRKYKRLRIDRRFRGWWTALLQRQPDLFTHWRTVRTYHGRSEEPGNGRPSRRDLWEPGGCDAHGDPNPQIKHWRGHRTGACKRLVLVLSDRELRGD
jgi:hypothetical protein